MGIKFIGPSPESISLMGDKARARDVMKKKGIPVMPGSEGVVTKEDEALEIAGKIGYPVIIKASAGGGGRGMRVVNKAEDLVSAYNIAQGEAAAAFGDGGVYIEKYFLEPRHIEVQIMGDNKGHILYLGERDCSIQRRHQKLIEESPSPVIDEVLRREMCNMAVEVAREVNYKNAGTVEFLLDKDHNFYFMEMNTRIQVEYSVTEMVTGIDMIREQIRIAAGRSLEFKQRDIKMRGHSIECRVNAECPETFTPCPGTITTYHSPGGLGVRVDSAAYNNYTVPPYYDSMIAKLIVYGDNRDEAISRMRMALDEYIIEGLKTTIPLYKKIFADPTFQKGKFSTNYLEKFLANNIP